MAPSICHIRSSKKITGTGPLQTSCSHPSNPPGQNLFPNPEGLNPTQTQLELTPKVLRKPKRLFKFFGRLIFHQLWML
jgi:hypothetical protein